MLAVLRRRLEMAVRVRDFLRAHRTEGLHGAEATALAQLGGGAAGGVGLHGLTPCPRLLSGEGELPRRGGWMVTCRASYASKSRGSSG